MGDEERQDETPEQQDQPEAEAEQPEAEESPESDAAAEGVDHPAEPDAGASEAEDQLGEAERARAEDSAGNDQPEPAEAAGDAKAKDQPPGAELEPIAIEEERELSTEERARREAEAEERARREAEATAEAGEEPAPTKAPKIQLEGETRFRATGKRKSSVARVMLLPGSGRFEVNRRELDEYFPRPFHQTMARQALVTTGYEDNVDVRVRVHGGGVSGQAGAVRHGVARALVEIDPELRGELKRRGLLTRDARRKERRKAGLKKARKRPQFSKR
jgi:small subunit ribosomal protein S9